MFWNALFCKIGLIWYYNGLHDLTLICNNEAVYHVEKSKSKENEPLSK